MSTFELTADPIMIENIRAGDVDGYLRKGQWYFNPETVRSATAPAGDSSKSELESYLGTGERIWLRNPIGRLQYFGWMWLISVSERVLTQAFGTPYGSTTWGWSLMMLVLLGLFVSSFVIIRKREIDITRSFGMTWRSALYAVVGVVTFGTIFLALLGEPLYTAVSEARLDAIGVLVFLPAHLSLLFQPGHLSAQVKRRRERRRSG